MKKNFSKVLYLAFALIIIVIIIVLWQMGSGNSNSNSATTAPLQTKDINSADSKQANGELASLQKQFMKLQDKNQSASIFIRRVRSYTTAYPSKIGGWVLLSQILMYDKQAKPAYSAISKAIKLNPKSATMQTLAGTLAMQADIPKKAAIHYQKAIDNDKSNGKYYILLASAQIKLKEYDKAESTLKHALDLDSSLYKAHAELSSVYAHQGKLTKALKQIRRVLSMVPDDNKDERLVYVQRRAKLLNSAGKPRQALSVLHDLKLKQRYKPDSLKIAGKAWEALNLPDKAADEYEQARVLYPVNKVILAWAIHYHIKAGNLDKARADLSDLKDISPNEPIVQMLQKDIDKTSNKSKN